MNQWQRKSYTCFVTSGSHWTVRLGHSRACVITKSYRNGVFFFQILYSSFMIVPHRRKVLYNTIRQISNNRFKSASHNAISTYHFLSAIQTCWSKRPRFSLLVVDERLQSDKMAYVFRAKCNLTWSVLTNQDSPWLSPLFNSIFCPSHGKYFPLIHGGRYRSHHMFVVYYYHFVGHCGAFCGLKWRIWRAKMYFNKNLVLSNELIKVELPPWKI